MSSYSRLFVISSLFYLLLGAGFGLFMAAFPTLRIFGRFPHAHMMVIGWISMMIFGLAYHVVPRFSGSPLIAEKWQCLHWWLANIALPGMIVVPFFQYSSSNQGLWNILFFIFGSFQFVGIAVFVIVMLKSVDFSLLTKVPSMPCCSSCGPEKKP